MKTVATPLRISSDAPADGFTQFWYWHGASGRRYIHSVYQPENCPPLPGAIFVAVKRLGNQRMAVAVDRFRTVLDRARELEWKNNVAYLGADEIHVHLMAKSHDHAEAILADLRQNIEGAAAAVAA